MCRPDDHRHWRKVVRRSGGATRAAVHACTRAHAITTLSVAIRRMKARSSRSARFKLLLTCNQNRKAAQYMSDARFVRADGHMWSQVCL